MLHNAYASKHRLQLLSRLPLPPQHDPFPEVLSWGVGCANRDFADWRRIFDTCDSPEPSSSKKKRTMVPSAWPDRIPFPDTLQRNTDRMMQYCSKTCTFIFISLPRGASRRVIVDVPHQRNLHQRQSGWWTQEYLVPVLVSVKTKHAKVWRLESGQLSIFIM